jgi:hypothetical protein
VSPDSLEPTGPIPLDERHEVLRAPLWPMDPILQHWEQHFLERGVLFARQVTRDGRVQLYKHKLRAKTPNGNGTQGSRWCCTVSTGPPARHYVKRAPVPA